MATTYILYSSKLDKYYIGSCKDFELRLDQHLTRPLDNSYASKADDWMTYLRIENLGYAESRQIESHIKKIKRRTYI